MKNFFIRIYAWLYDTYYNWVNDSVVPEPQPVIPLVRTVSELNSTPTVVVPVIPEPIVAPKTVKRKYTRRIHLKPVTRKVKKTQKKKNARRKNSS